MGLISAERKPRYYVALYIFALVAAFAPAWFGTRMISDARSQIISSRSQDAVGLTLCAITFTAVVVLMAVGVKLFGVKQFRKAPAPEPPVREPASRKHASEQHPGAQPAEEPHPERASPDQGRKVSILMLGFSGSGKTVMLTSLYECLRRGNGSIWLETHEPHRRHLLDLAAQIRGTAAGSPIPDGTLALESTRGAEELPFDVNVTLKGQTVTAFTLGYWDYAGGDAEGSPDLLEQQKKILQAALLKADIVMGVVDGYELAEFMSGRNNVKFRRELEELVNQLYQARQKSIHIVISKWDLLKNNHSLEAIIAMLDHACKSFRDFRRSREQLRIIPVAALGTNGFVYPMPGKSGRMARAEAGPPYWQPEGVTLPLWCAIPDIIEHDFKTLKEQADGPQRKVAANLISRLTRDILGTISAIRIEFPFTFLSLEFPVDKIREFFRTWRGRTIGPGALDDDEALQHVLTRCDEEVRKFEQEPPQHE